MKLPVTDFYIKNSKYHRFRSDCKSCTRELKMKEYREADTATRIWKSCKNRARIKGIEFNIEIQDIVIPDVCPVFGTEFEIGTEYTYSLDRFDNSLGYVKGNVRVISNRANKMKGYATTEEMRKILAYMES